MSFYDTLSRKLRAVRGRPDIAFQQAALNRAKHLSGASAYGNLHPLSLALCSVKLDPIITQSINLVLPGLNAAGVFAGVRTAVEFAVKLSNASGLNLRVIGARRTDTFTMENEFQNYLVKEFSLTLAPEVVAVSNLDRVSFGENDVWLATYWTTAHMLDVASRLHVIDASRVIYFVQDYEPGFFPWGTEYSIARSTYHAGFKLVVNSEPLRQYLTSAEGLQVDDDCVFAPSIDLVGAQRAYNVRSTSEKCRVLFYGRPSKPRNLFGIGVAALVLVAEEFERTGVDAEFISVGEKHQDVRLTGTSKLVSKGKLSWSSYFDTLANSDVLLSLQNSPHPSHPPLDAVMSGAMAVTNEFGGTRRGLHPNLFVAETDCQSLATEIINASSRVRCIPNGFDETFLDRLGRPIDAVVKRTLAGFTPAN